MNDIVEVNEDMNHKISTTEPNMIVEIQKLKIDTKQLKIKKTYESGYVIVDIDPYLRDYDETKGFDVNNRDFLILQEQFYAPTYSYEIVENISEDELNNLRITLGNELDVELKKLGWQLEKKEIWLTGKLLVEKHNKTDERY
jgi:hypothetical protein